jgi:hypothetical protein
MIENSSREFTERLGVVAQTEPMGRVVFTIPLQCLLRVPDPPPWYQDEMSLDSIVGPHYVCWAAER